MTDFEHIVSDGMTHWQYLRFFAYFSANAMLVSLLVENLTAVLVAEYMLWQTSPAVTKIVTRMTDWMRHILGMSEELQEVIQGSATSANVRPALTMRGRTLE